MKNGSEDYQRVIKENAKNELKRLENILSDKSTLDLLDQFKNKFNICESVYKVILKEHQLQIKGHIKGQLKLDMRQVPYAMAFAGYNIDKELLNRLFGAFMSNGTTIKKLRDSVTHGMNERAINEIIERKESLFKDMDQFLYLIRNS